MQNLAMYFDEFLRAFWKFMLEGGPFLLLGLFISGLIRAFVHTERMARWLGPNTAASAFKAALLGAPLPLCSCGVVPAAVTLRKQGASKAATQSFLITAPETGVDSIALTYAFLGPMMAIVRPIAAIMTGLTAGIFEMWWGKNESEARKENAESGKRKAKLTTQNSKPNIHDSHHHHSDHCCHAAKEEGEEHACCEESFVGLAPAPAPLWARFLTGQHYAFGPMLRDLAGWMLFGLILAALIQIALPAEIIKAGTVRYGLPFWMWYPIMAGIGIPMYICASMSTPVMAALILKGLSPGAALIFLLTGPATNVTTMGLIRRHLGRRSLTLYLSAVNVCAFGFGMLVDALAFGWPRLFIPDISRSAGPLLPYPVAFPLAVLLLTLLVQGWLLDRLARAAGGEHASDHLPRKLVRPIKLATWGLAGMVVITAWLQGLFIPQLSSAAVDSLVAQYNTTARPLAAAPALPPGLTKIQAPPVPISLADLNLLTRTNGPYGQSLVFAYQQRMLDLAGFFHGDDKPATISLPDGKTAPGMTITLYAAPDSTAGLAVDFLLDRWPKMERTSGTVRVTARLWVQNELTGTPHLLLYGNDFHPLRVADANDLGLLPTGVAEGKPAFRSVPLPLAEIETLANTRQGESTPLTPDISRLNGQRVRLDGYYVFTWQDPAGRLYPMVGLHYFDGVCCGVFPGPFNSVMVRLRSSSPGATEASAGNPFAGLRYGQKVSVEGVLAVPATLPKASQEPPIVLSEADVARVREPVLGDVRLVVILGLGVLMLLGQTANQAARTGRKESSEL